MSEWIKWAYRTIIILTVSTAVGLIGLVSVYALPSKVNLNTLRSSITLYENEGAYPNWANGLQSSMLDNFSDSIMLRNVIYPGSSSTLKDAILNPKIDYKNCNTVQALISQLKGNDTDSFVSYYPRYWHGYLIVLKPLTRFFDVSYIRLLNLIFQMILTAYLIAYLGTNIGKGVGISFFLTYLFLNPVSLAMSFQFSSVFYVMTLLSIVLIKWWDFFVRDKNYLYFFLISGILTAYFDLLTYPLVTLGIPLTLFFIKLHYHREELIKQNTWCKWQVKSSIVIISLFWCIGYGGMYIGKWLLALYITDMSVVIQALNQLQYRMSSYVASGEGGQVITPLHAILKNVFLVFNEPIFMILLFVLVFCIYKLRKINKESGNQDFTDLKTVLRIIMLYPFIWYALLSNHSFVHSFFAYRTLSIFIFAEGCYISSCFKENSF